MRARPAPLVALLLAACAAQPPSQATPTDSTGLTASPAPAETQTHAVAAPASATMELIAPTAAAATVPPQPSATPSPAAPTPTEAVYPGLGFPQAISGGGEGSMYPGQDISLIARTGHIQFLNVYANW